MAVEAMVGQFVCKEEELVTDGVAQRILFNNPIKQPATRKNW